MKIDRMIGILAVLLQRDKVTAPYLADKFEVSRRTISRDIEALAKAGIPIVTFPGAGGGISVMEGYRTDRTILTSADMQAILSGLGGLDSISSTKYYRQLMEKISADGASRDKDRDMIVDLSKWNKETVSARMEMIKEAIEEKSRISFHYYSPNGESDRMIEPYHLVFQWSDWYVWGYCLMREDYRMFKVSRMHALVNTKQPCARRNVPAYTCDRMRHKKGGICATVRFDEAAKWRLADEFGTDFLKYDENGSLTVTFTWSDVSSFYEYILSFGDKAEILAPESYREGFLELLNKMLSLYKT